MENTIALPPKEPTKSRKRGYDSDPDPKADGRSKKPNGKRKHGSDDDEVSVSDGGDDDEEDEWSHDDNDADADPEASRKKKRMSMIKQHLELLAEDSFKFLRLESNRGMGEWSVDYKELGKLMKQIEVEKVVEERFGGMGTRLLRIIKEKGRVDEKQVCVFRSLTHQVTHSVSVDRNHRAPQTEGDPRDPQWLARGWPPCTPGSPQDGHTTGVEDVFSLVL